MFMSYQHEHQARLTEEKEDFLPVEPCLKLLADSFSLKTSFLVFSIQEHLSPDVCWLSCGDSGKTVSGKLCHTLRMDRKMFSEVVELLLLNSASYFYERD